LATAGRLILDRAGMERLVARRFMGDRKLFLEDGDLSGAQDYAHRLKGAAADFGASEVTALALRIENDAGRMSPDELGRTVAELSLKTGELSLQLERSLDS
jgi:HPt (histidine-containing phosphotransfer) domain-containing protein